MDTLSTESRFTALTRGTGSTSGSRTTSLLRPRMVVVHGATSARRSRGIATSRDNTTTGRRPICGGSHHHTSPRNGTAISSLRPLLGTTRDRPIRQAHRAGGRHTRRTPRPVQRRGGAGGMTEAPRRSRPRQGAHRMLVELGREGPRRPSYSLEPEPCHKYATGRAVGDHRAGCGHHAAARGPSSPLPPCALAPPEELRSVRSELGVVFATPAACTRFSGHARDRRPAARGASGAAMRRRTCSSRSSRTPMRPARSGPSASTWPVAEQTTTAVDGRRLLLVLIALLSSAELGPAHNCRLRPLIARPSDARELTSPVTGRRFQRADIGG